MSVGGSGTTVLLMGGCVGEIHIVSFHFPFPFTFSLNGVVIVHEHVLAEHLHAHTGPVYHQLYTLVVCTVHEHTCTVEKCVQCV